MDKLEELGFARLPMAFAAPEMDRLADILACRPGGQRAAGRPGRRNVLKDLPGLRPWLIESGLHDLACEALSASSAMAVRAILFDKTPGANWRVPWHQDLSIAVRTRPEVTPERWGPWSEKEGVAHVQPPVEILERMITTRIHLDDCGADNGPLRVLPGTHRLGRLSASEIAATRSRVEGAETVCILPRGGVLLMKPLLLHASSPAAVPGRRQILHIEWASEPLPHGLEWFEAREGGS